MSTHPEALATTQGTLRPCTNLLACAVSATIWRPSSDFARKARSFGSPPRAIRRSSTLSCSRVRACGATTARSRSSNSHRVEIKLGASYPRTMPEIRWMTPIYHPNISEIGMVCLGGYGTHWVPSVQLDELCVMLWDMARYHNYDIRSPYNRDAALWVASQTTFLFPTDARPLRDLRAALGRVDSVGRADSERAPTGPKSGGERRDQAVRTARSPAKTIESRRLPGPRIRRSASATIIAAV